MMNTFWLVHGIILLKKLVKMKKQIMTIEQIQVKLKSHEYDFLRTDKRLGNNIIILVLGGSYAYGMAGTLFVLI